MFLPRKCTTLASHQAHINITIRITLSNLFTTGTVAGVLSGSVAGDHVSPISDTTVLSSLAAQCDLFRHVMTQAPSVVIVVFCSILAGTLPVGHGIWSTGVGISLGFFCIFLVNLLVAVPVISSTGRFDPFQELMMRFNRRPDLHVLKKHTMLCYARGEPISKEELKDGEEFPTDLMFMPSGEEDQPEVVSEHGHSSDEDSEILA